MQNPLEQRFKGTINLAHLWAFDERFLCDYEAVKDCTLLSPDRAYILWQFARGKKKIIELGVGAGGSASLMNLASPKSDMHLFDTFSGMPQNNEGIPEGTYEHSISEVQKLIPNSLIHKAIFEERDWEMKPENKWFDEQLKEIDLLHIDCDLAAPAREALRIFWPRLVSGGVIVIDDYGINLPALTNVVDGFCMKHSMSILRFSYAQAVIIKTNG